VAGRTLPAPVRTDMTVPKGTQHSYAAVGTVPVRMLFFYAPAGMEKMFDEIGKPAQPGVAAPPASEEDVAKLLSVAAKYNFTIVPPEGG
jgi:FAD/FMN-containing dehydrogenase